MANAGGASTSLSTTSVQSYVRGYHAYKDAWTPFIGETLVLKREPENSIHRFAVAVVLDGETVGHIPYNMAPTVSQFLRREHNQAFAEVTGERVNRGAGYGLEIPCKYHFYGPETYIEKLKELFLALIDKGLL